MVILDFGSGGTCRNNEDSITDMIDGLAEVDPDRKCVIKWQLWDKGTEPQCVRLEWDNFELAFNYASLYGFRSTASVFDKPSLDYLLGFDIPFVKIANRPYLRHLSRYVPRGIPIVYSVQDTEDWLELQDLTENKNDLFMACVSYYPTRLAEYTECFEQLLEEGISDHTVGLDLWRKYHPAVWEKHYRLPDQRGPDCGPWCITPAELEEVLA